MWLQLTVTATCLLLPAWAATLAPLCTIEFCALNGARASCRMPPEPGCVVAACVKQPMACVSWAMGTPPLNCAFNCSHKCKVDKQRPVASDSTAYCNECTLQRSSCDSAFSVVGPIFRGVSFATSIELEPTVTAAEPSPSTAVAPRSAPRDFYIPSASPSASLPAPSPSTAVAPRSAPRGFTVPSASQPAPSPSTEVAPRSAPRGFTVPSASPSASPPAPSPSTEVAPRSAPRGFTVPSASPSASSSLSSDATPIGPVPSEGMEPKDESTSPSPLPWRITHVGPSGPAMPTPTEPEMSEMPDPSDQPLLPVGPQDAGMGPTGDDDHEDDEDDDDDVTSVQPPMGTMPSETDDPAGAVTFAACQDVTGMAMQAECCRRFGAGCAELGQSCSSTLPPAGARPKEGMQMSHANNTYAPCTRGLTCVMTELGISSPVGECVPVQRAPFCATRKCARKGASFVCVLEDEAVTTTCETWARRTDGGQKPDCNDHCTDRCHGVTTVTASSGQRFCNTCVLWGVSCNSSFVIWGPIDATTH